MPDHPLGSSRAKIERAKEHYAALLENASTSMARRLMQTGERQSMSVRMERDQVPNTFHVIVEAVPPTEPFRWGLYVGDIAQNLRNALDHLAFALADKDSPGRGEDRATQFVISRDPAAFKNVQWHLRHLSPHHQDMVEQEQPYVRQPADVEVHPLTTLERLSNIDKHRVIHVVQLAADLFSYKDPSPFVLSNAQITAHTIYENPLEVGARLMTVTIAQVDPDGPDADIEIRAVLFAPTLALGPGQLLKHIVPNLTNYVEALVERFAAEF